MRYRNAVVIAFLFGIFVGLILRRYQQLPARPSPSSYDHLNNHIRFDRSVQMINRVQMPRRLHLKYLDEYQRKVDGWINHEILYFVWILSQFQYEKLKTFGAIGEIGVHHGKFTCYLYLMRRYEEQKLFAVDVFDNQLLNKDGSGYGQKDIFLRHVGIYAHVLPEQLAMYAGSSLDLNPVFSKDDRAIDWWTDTVVGTQGVQIISVSSMFFFKDER